ncbi:hypothetical protein BJ166DRAFT_91948 [Pestalotiopsis sp. NC0098]|nr:hypothetical protein BJ166DRAFT_91948 [Pestalotiopsis sp. NC0098]
MAYDTLWSSVHRRTKTTGFWVSLLVVFPVVLTIAAYTLSAPIVSLFGGRPPPSSSSGPGASLPVSGTRKMTFSEHADYMSLGHEHDMLWMDLLTPNGGFIKRPDKHNVERKYGISMFHQLHCLGMMREAVQDLTERLAAAEGSSGPGAGAQSRRDVGGSHGLHEPAAEPDHWLHCFDYLRQTILCNADATLEPPSITFQGNGVIDGMIQRECRDWEALYSASSAATRR